MRLFQFEHSRSVYLADFWIYGMVVGFGLPSLLLLAPADQCWGLTLLAVAGFVLWNPLEYLLHRFVLHGLRPFRNWHALHHERPTAFVASPTLVTLTLFAVLVWLPLAALLPLLIATALTLGLMAGYLAYAMTHHAVHNWPARGPWLRRQKLWHARHHHGGESGGRCYGVTGKFWDRLLKSDRSQVT